MRRDRARGQRSTAGGRGRRPRHAAVAGVRRSRIHPAAGPRVDRRGSTRCRFRHQTQARRGADRQRRRRALLHSSGHAVSFVPRADDRGRRQGASRAFVPAGFLVQPVEASEVAERLLRCIADGPRGRVTDFGGPEVLSFKDAAAQWQEARQVRKPNVPFPFPDRWPGRSEPARARRRRAAGDGFPGGNGSWGRGTVNRICFQLPVSSFPLLDPESQVPSPESPNRPC